MTTRRAECPYCGRDVSVREDGALRGHRIRKSTKREHRLPPCPYSWALVLPRA